MLPQRQMPGGSSDFLSLARSGMRPWSLIIIRVAMVCLLVRATLTSLPQAVMETIVSLLPKTDKVCSCLSLGNRVSQQERFRVCMGVQIDLALCCKATLPILCMGHVRVTINPLVCKRALLQLTRCLTEHPSGVLHLELNSFPQRSSIHGLTDLRCACACCVALMHARGRACCAAAHTQHHGWDCLRMSVLADAACCQTCASCSCATLPSPRRRCSQPPCGCAR